MPSKSSPSSKSNEKKAPHKNGGKGFELFHLLIIVSVVILTLALVKFDPFVTSEGSGSGLLGKFGDSLATVVVYATFGRWGAFALPVMLLLFLIGVWSDWKFKPWKAMLCAAMAGFSVGFGTALAGGITETEVSAELTGVGALLLYRIGVDNLQLTGTAILFAVIVLVFGVIMFNMSPLKLAKWLFYKTPAAVIGFFGSLKKKSADADAAEDLDSAADLDGEEEEATAAFEPEPSKASSPPSPKETTTRPKRPAVFQEIKGGLRRLPPLDLLSEPPTDHTRVSQAELDENSRRLEAKLRNLGIEARVIRTLPGPIITRYDLEPAAEVKIARIVGLADDIAMALRAPGVRILAPIPGEAAVGIEIPNRSPETVYMREVVASEEFHKQRSPLTIALGKDASGNIFCTDLARMPHLLIAGATGSGKSVCINVIISSLLYRSDPEKVRLVLIDPKKLELSLYARLSQHHLVTPPGLGEEVITNPENAVKTLHSVHAEMERRYDILAEAGVRGLEEYHRWLHNTPPDAGEIDEREQLPYVVVIIDELADLMMVVRKEFEELVARLAQMSRAVGIHLVVATQRPSVDVVTGLIKANFPARVAFQVASKFDSRTIIDAQGAETLLGRGDMLFQPPGTGRQLRLHGAMVTTEEVERIVEFVRSQPPCQSDFKLPDPELIKFNSQPAGEADSDIADGNDELFAEAAKIVVRTEQGSISLLQRRLRIGYARAARLIDQLEMAGVVGPFDGSKSRTVLMSQDDLRERLGIE